MAIQASKPNSRIFLLLGIVLAALAFGGVLFALRSASSSGGTSIVVSKTAVQAGTTITSDMVTTSSIPATAVPADAFTNPASVVGKTTTVTIAQNTPLVPAFFSTPPLTSSTSTSSSGTGSTQVSVETQITKGYVAMSLPVSATVPAGANLNAAQAANLSGDQVSAGYYIQPGDHIDVLIATGNSAADLRVRFAFQDLPVLRVGTSGASGGTPSMLLVEVPRSQAETLASLIVLPQHNFTIRYVLRPQSEWGKMAADGSSYTPNYESTNGPAVPTPGDGGVRTSDLDALFGR